MKYLITGGAGFVGTNLAEYLEKSGDEVVIFDKIYDSELAEKYRYYKGDIRNKESLDNVFEKYGPFDGVFHAAALMLTSKGSKRTLWDTNVTGTENVVKASINYKVRYLVFFSSSCVYGRPSPVPKKETEVCYPIELYGETKLEAEKILQNYKEKINIACFRCPTIVSAGRLGIISILFEFIKDNKNVYVIGTGRNKHHMLDISDLNRALKKSMTRKGFHVYNIASKNPESLKKIYQELIKKANSRSKVINLPKKLSKGFMKGAHVLKISPLGPYHYKMLSEDLVLNTEKIEKELGWVAKKKNVETFLEGYIWYINHLKEIKSSSNRSTHRSPAKMKIIRLLKYLS